MLLKGNNLEERKEKVVINQKKIHLNSYDKNTNLIKSQEYNQHQNYSEEEEEEESDYIYNNNESIENCNNSKTNIEVIPELQINELFLYWINLPNTQQLIKNYLKDRGLRKDILNNLTCSYFNPYIQRLEASEKKKIDLLDLQKFLFSLDSDNSNSLHHNHLISTGLATESDIELDNIITSEASSYKSNNSKLNKQKSIEIKSEIKTLPRERRKIRKLDSTTNTYINRLNTQLHKKEQNNYQQEFKKREPSDKIIKEDNYNTELTEIITEKDTIDKKGNNSYNKVTEKAMENNVLSEQVKDELIERKQNNENIIQG